MRPHPSGHIIRRCPLLLLWVFVSFLALLPTRQAEAQNVTFRPPQVQRGGILQSSVLFRPDEVVTIRWEEAVSGLEFKIGLGPGEYGYRTIQMRGDRSSQFSPNVVGLPVGVYYGILTDSEPDSDSSIERMASGWAPRCW